MGFFQNVTRSFLMNELYGIDPNAEIGIRDLHLLLKTFGFSHGRFIGAFPENLWLDELRKNVKLLGFDSSRLTRILSKNSDAIIPVRQQYKIKKNYPKDWLENALEMKNTHKVFTEIFSNTKDRFFDGPSLEDLLIEDEYDPSLSRGAHISADLQSYMHVMKPLLMKSSEIHFVDKFFFPLQNNSLKQKFIRALFIELKKSNRCERIYFHLSYQIFSPNKVFDSRLEDDFIFYINELRKESDFLKLGISYYLHEKMTHGRYFFSIKGGLQFDNGIMFKQNYENHIHWLGRNELEPLLDIYMENISFKSF